MPDWVIVAIIAVVVLFGASKLPDIARNLGRSSGEFKKGLKEGHDESDEAAPPPDAAPTPPSAPPAAAPSQPPATPTTAPAADATPPEPRSENPA